MGFQGKGSHMGVQGKRSHLGVKIQESHLGFQGWDFQLGFQGQFSLPVVQCKGFHQGLQGKFYLLVVQCKGFKQGLLEFRLEQLQQVLLPKDHQQGHQLLLQVWEQGQSSRRKVQPLMCTQLGDAATLA